MRLYLPSFPQPLSLPRSQLKKEHCENLEISHGEMQASYQLDSPFGQDMATVELKMSQLKFTHLPPLMATCLLGMVNASPLPAAARRQKRAAVTFILTNDEKICDEGSAV